MENLKRKKRRRRRKCLHCGELYVQDCRNRWHQRYCSKPACRQASKRASQARWLSSEKGRDYFHGAYNVGRVREWRLAHPGYWKLVVSQRTDALQEVSSEEVVVTKRDRPGLNVGALQDVCSSQPALLIGLIASLTGNALQDDIAETSRRYIILGENILGIGPGNNPKGGSRDGGKTHFVSGSSTADSKTV